jgi:hypothetical protein
MAHAVMAARPPDLAAISAVVPSARASFFPFISETPPMKNIRNTFARTAGFTLVCTALAALAACEGEDGPCKMSVTTGFKGNLEATYPNGDGGGGDGGGGDGGGGGAGGGGGEGKVLGGTLRVTRLSDNLVIGEAETDSEDGLVAIQTCGNPGALLLTLRGKAGATYFDEGKNAYVPFGPENELHALVNGLFENVGVTAFTEAAYRYAINNFLANPARVVDGTTPLQKTSAQANKLTPAQIDQANRVVLNEVNGKLPQDIQLSSLTSLPTPIGVDSPADSLQYSRYGIAAAVTGGFAWMANQFNPAALQSAALQATEELANDLTDGRVDGYALNGKPAFSALQGSTLAAPNYDSVQLPVNLHVGSNAVADIFGQAIVEKSPDFADISALFGTCEFNLFLEGAALLKDGSVTASRFNPCPGGTGQVFRKFATDVKQIGRGREALYLLKNDGRVSGWGSQHCSVLGDGGEAGYALTPVPIPGLSNITSVVGGPGYALARDSSGRVWSWGQNQYGNLGRLPLPSDPTCIVYRTANEGPSKVTTAPTLIPGLNDIVSINVRHDSVFGIDKQGALFHWGLTGLNNAQTFTPMRITGIGQVRAVSGLPGLWFALQTDGKVYGWGRNYDNNFGDGSTASPPIPKPVPTLVPGLTGVREIAGEGCSLLALKNDGSVVRWGGCSPASKVGTPTATPELANLKIRHLVEGNGGVYLYSTDGKMLEFGDQFGTGGDRAGVREVKDLFSDF